MFIVNFSLKYFSKKFFLFFLIFLIFFSFSKNVYRLNRVENIFVGIQKIDNKYILNEKNNNQLIKIYQPDAKKNRLINGWQGQLCWDIPFICTYNALDVRKKNGYLIINKLSK